MKDAVFTMKLEPALRDAFAAEAAADDRSAAQIVREFMRGYVEHRQQDREYQAFVRRKVQAGLADVKAGRTHAAEDVEAEFAARIADAAMRATIAARVQAIRQAHANNLIEGLDMGADVLQAMLQRAREPIGNEEFTRREKALWLQRHQVVTEVAD